VGAGGCAAGVGGVVWGAAPPPPRPPHPPFAWPRSWTAYDKERGLEVAMHIIPLSDAGDYKSLVNVGEDNIVHESIIRVEDLWVEDGKTIYITQIVTAGTLQKCVLHAARCARHTVRCALPCALLRGVRTPYPMGAVWCWGGGVGLLPGTSPV
jgi:hypothetical protein